LTKNLFAFVTFGGLEFTKLAVQSIRETVANPYDLFAVVGKPEDNETREWLLSERIPHTIHNKNMGFSYSINDIFDYAWKFFSYDNLILLGNDIILYPYSGDSLINFANSTNYEIVSAKQYDVRDLIKDYPETSQYFQGEKLIIEDFSGKPWERFTDYSKEVEIADMQLFDIQNFCLYKKSVFDKVGYTDVNYYPAYFTDNDYAKRMDMAGVKGCTLTNARFFHFWSRVFKQGSGGSTDHFFDNNLLYYKSKWGGVVGKENRKAPIKIDSRDNEEYVINLWRKR
jgi:GT2 family glycosyltransferase